MGAAIGEVAGLNVPTRHATRPPNNPTRIKGPRNSGCVQPNADDPMHNSNKMPVLLMTPCKLIGWLPAQAVERALSRFSNGFEVSIALNSYAVWAPIATLFGGEIL